MTDYETVKLLTEIRDELRTLNKRLSAPTRRGPKTATPLTEELQARALLLRENCVGTEAIAKAIGVPRTTVRNFFERHDAEAGDDE